MKQIRPLGPTTYRRHLIHGEDRVWTETNCYVDVLVELLHGLGYEPMAALPFTLTIDFEGDQWTFFKFPPGDLLTLYGLDIQELNVWRPLVLHIEQQVGAGRPVLVELDSYFLPDTAGTAYRLAHVKTTVAVNAIDVEGRQLGYFHNQSYHQLQGQDFSDVFQLEGLVHERMLPPYIEYVKLREEYPRLEEHDLRDASLALLQHHLKLIPKRNPFRTFKEKFSQDLEWLIAADLEAFHTYSFATLRQYGACFELAETYLRWLTGQGVAGLDVPVEAFNQIAQTAKTFQFQLARSMARRRPLDLALLDAMAGHWDQAMSELTTRRVAHK